MSDTLAKADGGVGGAAALRLVEKLPPEVLVQLVGIIADVVRTRAGLAEKHADFIHDMQRLEATAAHRERVLSVLSNLLLSAELNDEAKLRLVEGICELALR